MTYDNADVVRVIEDTLNEIISIRKLSVLEYSSFGTPFSNFEKLATELGIPREKILWVYAMKHKDGIANYLNGVVSQREPIAGRIDDLIHYLLILKAMIYENMADVLYVKP